MRLSIVSSLLLVLSLFSLFQTPTSAEKKSYIVYLGSHPRHLSPSHVDHDHAVRYHQELLASCLGSIKKAKSSIFYSYNRFINGFAAVLDEQDVAKVRNHPKVVSVFLNQGRKLQTTHSWNFLGLEKDDGIPLNSAWKKGRFGEDIIIGNLDSGVWPESKSFSDEGMDPVPTRWRGTCQTNNKDGVKCNRKLIGVRYFNRGYLKYARRVARRQNTTYTVTSRLMTARDNEGHGSHTLAIAGGNFVANVNVFGNGNGTAKGGSPKARVAAYKVCWEPIDSRACFDADILAAMEAAISDGVDVLSLSIGGAPQEYFNDGIAIGSFHAVKNGIVVVAAGGNTGPLKGSVTNTAPWLFTVGASTTNREFVNYVTLGNKKILKGISLSDRGLESEKLYPLITGADARSNNAALENATGCVPGTLDEKKVNGKILVCLWLGSKPVEIGQYAAQVGAAGMILANPKIIGKSSSIGYHVLPTSHLSFIDGESVFAYINSTKNPVAHISNVQTKFNTISAPRTALISSRGPNLVDPSILKPDIIAPGVNIIAAYTESSSPSHLPSDNRRLSYAALTGTSMACPHVSGIVGLLKAAHRDWSPAAIRSAIMTTASTGDQSSNPILNSNNLEATPFEYGAGHVNPNRALDPGLVYDMNAENYLNYLCNHGYNESIIKAFTISDKPYSCPKSFRLEDFNYPSFALPFLNSSITCNRYLKNVGTPGRYNVSVKAPAGVSISVEPKSLEFGKHGEEKRFAVIFSPEGNDSSKDYVYGELIWSDGYHNVRSSIAVRRGHPAIDEEDFDIYKGSFM